MPKKGKRKLPEPPESPKASKSRDFVRRKEIKAREVPKVNDKVVAARGGQLAEDHLRKKGTTETKAGKLSKDKVAYTLDQARQQMASKRGQNTSDQCDYRCLIAAIYNELKHASPSVIRESMSAKSPVITSERVHLQKYRLYRTKSKGEFMTEYDNWMAKVTHAVGVSDLTMGGTPLASPREALQLLNAGTPSSGALAAYLTYSVLVEERSGDQEQAPSSDSDKSPSEARLARAVPQNPEQREILAKLISELTFVFPKLTEEEKQSGLGRMLMHVMALCMELNDRILEIRQVQTGQTYCTI
jgi:hypothetical protein